MAGAAPGRCPSLRLKELRVRASARAGLEQLRRRSCTAKRPGLGLPAAAQNDQTVYGGTECTSMISCTIIIDVC